MALFWTQRQDIGPSGRYGHAIAYDTDRKRTVLFGGRGDEEGVLFGDTWEWDGDAWTQVQDIGPSARANHAVAYDSARSRLVLFGGGANAGLGDTWEWDGEAWTQVQDEGPAVRAEHAMVFDSKRSRVVLFGGVGAAASLGDTWEWDGADWTQVQDTGPSARGGHAMAFDPQAPRVVLFGGSGTSDTWAYANGAWSQLNDVGPAPCEQTAMAFAGATYLFGGVNTQVAPAAIFGLTWELDGKNWTERQDIGPSPRWGHAMSFDSDRGKIVLFGGNPVAPPEPPRPVGDTWELPPSPLANTRIVLLTITVAPSPVRSGQQVTATVTLSGPAPTEMAAHIALVRTPIGIVDLPLGSITWQAGQTQASATVTLPANLLTGVYTISATTPDGATVTTNVAAN